MELQLTAPNLTLEKKTQDQSQTFRNQFYPNLPSFIPLL